MSNSNTSIPTVDYLNRLAQSVFPFIVDIVERSVHGHSTYAERTARRRAAAEESEDEYDGHSLEFADNFYHSASDAPNTLALEIYRQYGSFEMGQAFHLPDQDGYPELETIHNRHSEAIADRRIDRLNKYRERSPLLHQVVKKALLGCKESHPEWTKGFFKHMETAVLAGVNTVRVTDFLLWYPDIPQPLFLALRSQSRYYHGEAALQFNLRLEEANHTFGHSSIDSLHPEILDAAAVTTIDGNSSVQEWEVFGLGKDERGIANFEMCWENRENGLARLVHIKANLVMREAILKKAPEGVLRWEDGERLKDTLEHKIIIWCLRARRAVRDLAPLYTADRVGKEIHEYRESVLKNIDELLKKADPVEFGERKDDVEEMVRRVRKAMQLQQEGKIIDQETVKAIKALEIRLWDWEDFHKAGLLGSDWEKAGRIFDVMLKAQEEGTAA